MSKEVKQKEVLKCGTKNCYTIIKVDMNKNIVFCSNCKKEIKK